METNNNYCNTVNQVVLRKKKPQVEKKIKNQFSGKNHKTTASVLIASHCNTTCSFSMTSASWLT